ncbi:MAG: hypothetical protein WBV95_05535, partial [Desulfobacterales bacterium]
PGPGLEPVSGEFQPSFATGYPGGGAHLILGLNLTIGFLFYRNKKSPGGMPPGFFYFNIGLG